MGQGGGLNIKFSNSIPLLMIPLFEGLINRNKMVCLKYSYNDTIQNGDFKHSEVLQCNSNKWTIEFFKSARLMKCIVVIGYLL